ncbi:hypothetical protein SAMN05518847_102301 [Paenibacillus sp. OV219]|nr:hypothetical protein SAMN05518847_102301 [Paenibacillus sp. OV219]
MACYLHVAEASFCLFLFCLTTLEAQVLFLYRMNHKRR